MHSDVISVTQSSSPLVQSVRLQKERKSGPGEAPCILLCGAMIHNLSKSKQSLEDHQQSWKIGGADGQEKDVSSITF